MRAQICIYLPYVSTGMDGEGLGDIAQTYVVATLLLSNEQYLLVAFPCFISKALAINISYFNGGGTLHTVPDDMQAKLNNIYNCMSEPKMSL